MLCAILIILFALLLIIPIIYISWIFNKYKRGDEIDYYDDDEYWH